MTRPTLIALLVLSLVAAPGCSTLNLSSLWGDKVIVADARHPVTEVMCLWEEGEGTGLDGMPTRGFAGQILFFTSDPRQPSPMKVNGDIRIYVFDDEGVRGDMAQPIHQFDFPGTAWNVYMASSNFGTTYQLFIPYTKPGAHQANCEIRVRYTPESGNPVYSRPCTIALSGIPRGKGTARSASARGGSNASMIQQASHEVVGNASAIDPHTLQVPPSISSLAAESNGRARTIQVKRLNRLADSLAEERGIEPLGSAPATGESVEPAPTPTRRRLNPLSGETPAPEPAQDEPVDEAVTAEARAKHILLSD